MKQFFYKLHGAGNDFIFFEGSPFLSAKDILMLCKRSTGIGADGIVFLEKDYISQDGEKYPFRMVYFNSDGEEADFCGNGARCSVLLAHELNYFDGNNLQFIAKDGVHRAEVLGDKEKSDSDSLSILKCNIKLQLNKPNDLRRNISILGEEQEFDFVNTGVEHSVIYKNSEIELKDFDIKKNTPIIRNNEQFTKGTNVNYIFKNKETSIINIRTFEKGVEDETLACGTGIAAAGYIDMLKTNDFSKRTIKSLSGDLLSVELIDEYLYLTGPAVLLYRGEI